MREICSGMLVLLFAVPVITSRLASWRRTLVTSAGHSAPTRLPRLDVAPPRKHRSGAFVGSALCARSAQIHFDRFCDRFSS